MAPPVRSIDYTALVTPILRTDIVAFKMAMKAAGRSKSVNQGLVVGIVLLGFPAAIAAIVFLGNIVALFFSPLSALVGLIVSFVILAACGIPIVFMARALGSLKGWESWYRLDLFARSNAMVYSPRDEDPTYPGAIFGLGYGRAAIDHFMAATGRFVDYGNYIYTTGSGKNAVRHGWGFMAIQLDRMLPNMMLDSRANNGVFGGTNLPAYFDKDQVLSLEGDFDTYFTLYCPRQYERDALYVFTPDLMALLIDEVAPFDVEIVDNWMFVYAALGFTMLDPAVHQRMLRIVDTVGAKTLSQTERYADDRAVVPAPAPAPAAPAISGIPVAPQVRPAFAANVVAPQGRRLARGWSIGGVIALCVVAVILAVPQLVALIFLVV